MKPTPTSRHPVDTCQGHVHGEGCGHSSRTARRSHRLHRQRPPAPPTRRPLRRSRSGRDCEVSAIEAVSSEIALQNKRSSENAASVKTEWCFQTTFCVFHLIEKEGRGKWLYFCLLNQVLLDSYVLSFIILISPINYHLLLLQTVYFSCAHSPKSINRQR